MIEIVNTEKGNSVIKRDGRLLASRFDPWKEAEEWVARRNVFLAKVKTIFVLGLASGYHVALLAKKTESRIVVIEPDVELITANQKIHSFDRSRVLIESVHDLRGLRSSDVVRNGVRESFLVLTHFSSQQAHGEFFHECQTALLARDWSGLTWQWQIKGHPDLDSQPRIESNTQPLTIYDLEQTELVQNSQEREQLILKALRELVK